MNRTTLALICVGLLAAAGVALAAAPAADRSDPAAGEQPLPRWMTPEEQAQPGPFELDEITPPPDGPVTLYGEFEEKQGLLLRWPFYYSDMFASLVDEIQDVAIAFILVANESQEQSCINTLANYGVGLENVEFIYANTNAIWVRDYGPWFVQEGYDWAINDLIYYNSRPLDDYIPQFLSDYWDYGYYGPNIHHEGGNMMNDGHGTMMMSTRVFEANPSYDEEMVDEIYQDYFGQDESHIFERISLDGTGHIDLWAKIMNETTILVAEMQPDDVNYDLVESHAETMDDLPTYDGGTFDIVRCPMPPVAYQGGYPYYRSYINSVLINHKAIIPIYNLQWDDEAIAAYQEALGPDWEVVGIESNDIAPLGGAIHCVMIEIPYEITPPVTIQITPVADPIIIPFGGGSFQYDATLTNNLDTPVAGQVWTEAITPEGTVFGPILLTGVQMAPGQVIQPNTLSQYVPGGAPGGDYTFVAKVGLHPEFVVSMDEFEFYKQGIGGANGGALTLDDWTESGGDLPAAGAPPAEFALGEPYPNPFNPATSLTVTLPEDAELTVAVYNVSGREVATLADGRYSAGEHRLTLDGSKLASGVYFVRASVPGRLSETRKLMLVR
ncbi:MAG: Peptidylarginine deiminase [Calditrichaeota bacterium]|nr:Peptidylarginine deiminase [Calditrichota bacterium]